MGEAHLHINKEKNQHNNSSRTERAEEWSFCKMALCGLRRDCVSNWGTHLSVLLVPKGPRDPLTPGWPFFSGRNPKSTMGREGFCGKERLSWVVFSFIHFQKVWRSGGCHTHTHTHTHTHIHTHTTHTRINFSTADTWWRQLSVLALGKIGKALREFFKVCPQFLPCVWDKAQVGFRFDK